MSTISKRILENRLQRQGVRSGRESEGERWGNGAKRREAKQGGLGAVGVGIVSSLLLAGSLSAQAAQFIPLGFLPGDNYSYPTGVSDDGSVVVGWSGSTSTWDRTPRWEQAFRWTAETGMTGLVGLPGSGPSRATGVSADGSVVVGSSYSTSHPLVQAFRWTAETGMAGPVGLPGGGPSRATGVSADGSVVVGSSYSTSYPLVQAFRWTAETGMISLGVLPQHGWSEAYSEASGVSADGSVVVGRGGNSGSGKVEAFRWENGTMTGLGFLPGGGDWSEATGVSADGSVVVGMSDRNRSLFVEAFRWENGTMTGLGFLPGEGDPSSGAYSVSADGSVVVGWSTSSGQGAEAFIWDQLNGMRSLLEMLINDYNDHGLGSQLSNWSLTTATAISPNGRHIVGWGRNPSGYQETWLVRLDAVPVPLPAAVSLFVAGLAALTGFARRR